MAYPPANPFHIPLFTYLLISASVNSLNFTPPSSCPASWSPVKLFTKANPEITWCLVPDSSRNILSASASSLGFPTISPLTTTIVSPPMINASVSNLATAKDFWIANSVTNSAGSSVFIPVSSYPDSLTSNSTPNLPNSSLRLALPLAKIIRCIRYTHIRNIYCTPLRQPTSPRIPGNLILTFGFAP